MGVLSKDDKATLNELSTKCVNLINTWNKPQTTTVLKSTDKPQKDSFVLDTIIENAGGVTSTSNIRTDKRNICDKKIRPLAK